MATPIIEVQNLTYFYPGKKALDDVSFSIEKGSITALVGPNGAGKTTLLRTLAGLELPFSGKINVAGLDVLKDPRLAHTRMGFLSDDFGLYNDLTVDDVLEFIGGCHNLDAESLKMRISWVIDLMNLGKVRGQKCGTLSRGWRQRTGIGLAILNRPEVLILDEPASGLDPEARFELSGIMRSLQSIGITSLVSSHILSELEEYCTAMLVLRDGRVLQNVSLETQREKGNAVIVITFARPVTAEQELVISATTGQQVTMLNSLRTSVRINASNDPEQHYSILKLLVAKELPVCGFTLEGESLQSLYLEMSETSNRGSR